MPTNMGGGYVFIPGDTTLAQLSTSTLNTDQESPVLVGKRFRALRAGAVRINFSISTSNASNQAYALVQKNGVTVQSASTTSTSSVEINIDVSVSANDIVSVKLGSVGEEPGTLVYITAISVRINPVAFTFEVIT